ncbi:hypothetical protein BS47DRAFT_1387949 [Hydnum rufescens UP504]|uniref:MaoC-like domain-containing protein n=1 Tax=Hydnum rufescens UP504 TaxID=1448309 RepID=A0A9P6BA28_9AGAM|nr:hypothetical protein BS47DRAFT_1387949 [Hydnum rufescens UP504]
MLGIGGQLHVLRPRCLGSLVVTGRRHFSEDQAAEITAWMRNMKDFRKLEEDRIDLNRVHQLFVTLPSRDGSTGGPVVKPKMGDTLPLGHHLILFPPIVPGHQLHEDGTDSTYAAPPFLTRRMWAGGASISIRKTPSRLDKMCKQLKQLSNSVGVAVTERRSHVFLPPRSESSRPVRKVVQFFDPTLSHFSFAFVPTPAMLFRFSALTFNAHMIHLDPEFCRKVDGHPERLVHGPLTAMMLLELMTKHTSPSQTISSYSYRAMNPLVVGKPVTLHGTWSRGKETVRLTAVDHLGQEGMTADVRFEPRPSGIEQ